MSKLPQQDPTVLAIYDGIAQDHNELPRAYLGASSIGDSCPRKLWMGFRWVKFEKFEGRLLRLFDTGHLEEPRMIADLERIGVKAIELDERTGDQFGISYHGGHFRGHTDGVALGIISDPTTWHLLEFKTHNDKSYKLLTKNGMEESKPMHYAQMQVYMNGLGLKKGYYLAKNKNDDSLYGEVIHYNPEVAQLFIDRAEVIIFDSEPSTRISDNPSWYECKWCHYSDYCHGTGADLPTELPNVNCRTCIHSTPKKDGTWVCEHHHVTLDYDAQVAACQQHLFIPNLFPDLEFDYLSADGVEGDCDKSIFYRSRDGETYNNSAMGVISKIGE
jgi:hypothetical protein